MGHFLVVLLILEDAYSYEKWSQSLRGNDTSVDMMEQVKLENMEGPWHVWWSKCCFYALDDFESCLVRMYLL